MLIVLMLPLLRLGLLQHSGFLGDTEGLRFLERTGCAPDELQYYWQDLLRTADANGDGQISKHEFLKYVIGEEELSDSGEFTSATRARARW